MANDFDSSVKERLDSAANSIKRGDIVRGREGLERVLEQEPDNALAWLWMSRCIEGREEKLACFKKVLEVDPNNEHALKGMRIFGQGKKAELRPDVPPSTIGHSEGTSLKNLEPNAGDPGGIRGSSGNGRKWALFGTFGVLVLAALGCLLAALVGLFDFQSIAAMAMPPLSTESSSADIRVVPSATEEVSIDTPIPTSTPTNTLVPTATSTYTPRPTATNTPTPPLGDFNNPAAIGDRVVRTDDPFPSNVMALTVSDVKRGQEATALAKSEGIWEWYSSDPLIEGQEFLALRIRMEVLEGPAEKVFLLAPYWHLTLRYEADGSDTWGTEMALEIWAESYPPIESEGWFFFVVRQGSEPTLYFHPNLIVSEQLGYRTSGAYINLGAP